ncbi:hypothetical protein LCGC14_1269760 [marine sediment metagenome]|uniref:Nucleotidyl transferase AbiEii/AbiGii toxin family protein n=1 Tax=marine sediment metagenome TaxID=412755 RepID=A0A0F9P1J3_9ZZZZ
MNPALKSMLDRYSCNTANDYKNALKEIIQEMALLGLWRSKFFEHAAFYGDTSLRILYGLDRFSEDLDFSLLKSNPNLDLKKYYAAVQTELQSFGLKVTVEEKEKSESRETAIKSAFIKAGTRKNIIQIEAPDTIRNHIQHNEKLKVKIEVDINPPGGFSTEVKILLQPIPFSVNTFTLPNLFAGKLHSVLCRRWKNRIKGRDWYDFVWYVARKTPLNLYHLEQRMTQTGNWEPSRQMMADDLQLLLKKRIEEVNFDHAGNEVLPFIRDPEGVALWSKDFFYEIATKIKLDH